MSTKTTISESEDEDLASPAFLTSLASLFPSSPSPAATTSSSSSGERNPWHIVAAVSYCASNRPEAVPLVLKHALEEVERNGGGHEARLRVVRELRDGMFKAGLICGYSRAIIALITLYEATPEVLRDKKMMRDPNTSMEEYVRRGDELFRRMYGDSGDYVRGLLYDAFPDMGFFSDVVGYGITYGHLAHTSQLDTTYAIVAALIAMDTPRQVAWHLANARRGGASLEEVRAVREMALRVARRAGVVWRNVVPEVEEAGEEEWEKEKRRR